MLPRLARSAADSPAVTGKDGLRGVWGPVEEVSELVRGKEGRNEVEGGGEDAEAEGAETVRERSRFVEVLSAVVAEV